MLVNKILADTNSQRNSGQPIGLCFRIVSEEKIETEIERLQKEREKRGVQIEKWEKNNNPQSSGWW